MHQQQDHINNLAFRTKRLCLARKKKSRSSLSNCITPYKVSMVIIGEVLKIKYHLCTERQRRQDKAGTLTPRITKY